MTRDNTEAWADLEEAFQEQYDYDHCKILRGWISDRAKFIKDHMDLAKTSYEAGYMDALDDARKAFLDMQREMDSE